MRMGDSSQHDVREYADRFLAAKLNRVDPVVDEMIGLEAERQARRIILIPSESIAPLAVREALGSVFQNIYAEGYPSRRMMALEEEELLDYGRSLTHYRRYSDRRFYKGTEFADLIESLAQRRIAQCFATRETSPDQIYVNVQPLSGAAANLAVYEAFLDLGDTIMGMALSHGGHLTHGSPFNISGRRYRVAAYEVDPRTGRLDYDQIRDLARQHRPKMIVAGYTSYPWAPDWHAFRSICDEVDALLMADIAHTAGLVVGGAHPSPVGLADVITFTTHKTVCGPRGAVVMTADPRTAARVEAAIFPGEQGGPHVQKFAAMAVAFEIARSDEFRALQQRIVHNARSLASALQAEGLVLAYGGTDTHLLLIDLAAIDSPSGYPLMGEIAARILDLCGIVCNKNTVPGDTSAADARGIRLGTPWITQRGISDDQIGQLAAIIARVLVSIHPFSYRGLVGQLPRGKLDLDVLEQAKREVDELAGALAGQADTRHGYPYHFYEGARMLGGRADQVASVRRLISEEDVDAALTAASATALVLDLTDNGIVLVRDHGRSQPFLDEALTADIAELASGGCLWSLLLDKEGQVVADVVVLCVASDGQGGGTYLLVTPPAVHERVKAWLRGLADGYVLFDQDDIFRKVQGPAAVEDVRSRPESERLASLCLLGPRAAQLLGEEVPPVGAFVEVRIGGADILIAHPTDTQFLLLAHPAGTVEVWDELLRRGAVGGGRTVWRELRARERLPAYGPDEARPTGLQLHQSGHTSLFCFSKPYFVGQQSLHSLRPTAQRPAFVWQESVSDGLKRTPLYQAHLRFGARMTPFAGWEMPVWYTSVLEEHRAVREAAGLFDVGHMGVFEIAGPHAIAFLDTVTTNYVRWLEDGWSQYGYLLDADGRVLDDIMVYRRDAERYLMVVNAANEAKDWAWLNAVNQASVVIDRQRPDLCLNRPAILRNLKNPMEGPDQRIDLALQGPNSLSILQSLTTDDGIRRRLALLQRTRHMEVQLHGLDLIVARTGYTGEEVGYEVLVHPDDAETLWNLLLEHGEAWGIRPAGLGARDSVRTEAGLPLYGHELAGPLDITPTEAGFGPYVKFHKPFFVGRDPTLARSLGAERESARDRTVIRFRVNEKGQRKVNQGDPVVSRQGRCIGWVTSCSLDVEGFQLGLALVGSGHQQRGASISIFPLPARHGPDEKPKDELEPGDRVLLDVEATVLSRFPEWTGEPD